LLVGHSCGATIAFQVAMIWREESTLAAAFTKPLGILGVEGIYDLVALRDNHGDAPYYQQMVKNVFGSDEVSLNGHDLEDLQVATPP
jgi:kynurenine formamidase